VEPTFSVVIPCFNEARYLSATLESLRNQTYPGGYEILVVDNACTDDTVGIATGYGVPVVTEPSPGVCSARQAGTLASRGRIVVSTDADTTHSPDWLARIDRRFGQDERLVAVVGPCRYRDGPLWGRIYARALFASVHLVYRLTGHVWYVTATNIAFKREYWPGYDLNLTQGGDELDLLRRLRRRGRVAFDHANPTFTSGRRFSRGLVYNVLVTLLVHYLAAYWLNRLFHRRVLGSAPAYRDSGHALVRLARSVGLAAVFAGVLLLPPFTPARIYLMHGSHAVLAYMMTMMSGLGRS